MVLNCRRPRVRPGRRFSIAYPFHIVGAVSLCSPLYQSRLDRMKKNGAVGFPLPSRSRSPLVAVVNRVGDNEVVIAHHIRCARDGKHVVFGG